MIEILKYNAKYPIEFKKIKSYLNLNTKILHVGSTSIKGLYSKPIIDIDIIYNNDCEKTTLIKALSDKGYTCLGDLGIKERYAFQANEYIQKNFFPHHLYLVKNNSLALKNHLIIQNALQKNNELRDKYSALKLSLVNSESVDEYCKNKTAFITSILKKDLSEKEIQEITKENLE